MNSIQKGKISTNLSTFYEKNRSKTIKTKDLKQKLEVAHICIVVPNKF